jgi:phosphatidylinositol glycan class B
MAMTCRFEPSQQTVRRYLIANLAFIVVTSYFSVTFFHPDEHYQVLEFVGLKLGTTTTAQLPWEFHHRMRPWLQPGVYYALTRGAEFLGVRDVFTIVFLLRLATGLLAWIALGRMVRTSLGWCADAVARLGQLRVTTLLGFLPYLCVRTSSENVSCSLATIGFCTVVDALRATNPLRPRAALAAGLLFGLAFECRFPTAVIFAGLVAWLCVFRRVRMQGALALAGGAATAVVLGLFFDRWGYGEWSFPACHYFRKNLIDGVASTQFGTEPFYGYLYLLPANIFAPVVVALMTGLALTWVRRPKHPVTWTTLPFALVHCALSHKEERFFFPIVLISTASVALGFSPAQRTSALPRFLFAMARRADAVARKIWSIRRSALAAFVAADSALGMLLLAIYPLGWRPDVTVYEYIYHHVAPDAHIWKRGDWDFPDYPFYRRSAWYVDVLATGHDPAQGLRKGEAAYLVTRLPYDEAEGSDLGATPKLAYSEFPGWQYASVRALVGPALQSLVRALDPIPRIPKAKWLTLYRLEANGAPSDGGERR